MIICELAYADILHITEGRHKLPAHAAHREFSFLLLNDIDVFGLLGYNVE